MLKTINILSPSKDGFNGKRIIIEKHLVETENGTRFFYEVAKVSDAVAILPVLDDGRFILILNHRYPINETIIEIPAGKMEKDDKSPLDRAKAELREETGYIATHWTSVGVFATSPGIITERIHLYVAKGLTFVGRSLEDSELGMETVIVKPDDLKNPQIKNLDMKTAFMTNLYLSTLKE